MNVSFQIAGYLGILRKHLLLLLVSAALVIAAGFVYLNQQVPVYQASAKMLLTVPERSAMGPRDVTNPFTVNRNKLNTEIHLLRDNTGMAMAVVKNLEELGIDVVAGGYTEGELRGRVQVDFIPGTELVRFSLTGPVAETLPTAVNEYARVYKEQTEQKSAVVYTSQVDQLEAVMRSALDDRNVAREALDTFRTKNSTIELQAHDNPFKDQAMQLARMIPGLEDEAMKAKGERTLLEATLARLGVTPTPQDNGGWELVESGDPMDPLWQLLGDDEVIVGMPFVAANDSVRSLVQEEADAERADRRLERGGDLPESDARRAVAEDKRIARKSRGGKIVQLVRARFSEYDAIEERLEARRSRFAETRKQEQDRNRLLAEYDQLAEARQRAEEDLETAEAQLERFTGTWLKTNDDEGQKTPTLLVDIRSPARSAVQVAPNQKVILGLTFFAAIAIGLGLVLLFEYLDDTIKSKEDFDRYVGLPFLGFVPHIGDDECDNRDLAADSKPGSPIAESFRTIRTSILFSRGGAHVKTVLVTSAGPGEGKTTVATNLAATLAKHKGPVLLIDCDLRRPRVAKALRVKNTRGLTNCLIGDARFEDVVQETPVEGLHVLPSGPIPPNPAELLHGERMAELLVELRGRYDRIVIDSPPVVAVTDARVLASQVDGLYMVISMGKTSRRVIQRALESITSIGFGVHGVILNNLTAPTGRYGYYYYRDYAYGKGYYKTPDQASERPPAG